MGRDMQRQVQLTRKEFVAVAIAALSSTAMPAPIRALNAPNSNPSQQPPQQGTDITVDDLMVYEKMIGLEFTDEERQAILSDVRRLRASYRAIRSKPILNGLSPSTVFVPQGKMPPEKTETLVSATRHGRLALPSNEEDIAFLSVAELGSLIRRKLVSPTELTELFLKRLDRYGSKLLNVITMTESVARLQAKTATEEIVRGRYKGPLHGIPYGIKDLFATKGFPTTWGAAPYQDQKLDFDAAVVEKLAAAGAVLCAKLSLGALAMNDVWFAGRTKNPWNPAQGSSGSSAGSASAVAAGLIPFSIGTETQGSIVSPAHRCRVTGLRPTFGRVSRFGAMALSWTMDKPGPMCRTAEDCALVLAAIIGTDSRDPSATNRPFVWSSETDARRFLSGVKIGYVVSGENPDPDTIEKTDFLKLAKGMGADLTPVAFSPLPEGITIDLSVESAAAFDEFTRTDRIDGLTESMWPNIFRAHRYVPAVEYIQAMRLRTQVMEQFERELGDLDIVLAPERGGMLLLTTNRTGHPQLLIPNGSERRPAGDTEQEVERSFSIFGRLYDEATVLKVGWLMQQQLRHHLKRPDLSKL